ncbi:MAG: type II toxin-antitoxin system RelE/ParE family toxin [Acidobacteria bacterium]|nr:type II toxin-antitoxin system RelE/ParE family toxin [Acidobacteriota bacterium]
MGVQPRQLLLPRWPSGRSTGLPDRCYFRCRRTRSASFPAGDYRCTGRDARSRPSARSTSRTNCARYPSGSGPRWRATTYPFPLCSHAWQQWITRNRCSTAADAAVDRVFSAIEVLERHPQMGRSGRVPRTRELVITGTPFVVAYREGRHRDSGRPARRPPMAGALRIGRREDDDRRHERPPRADRLPAVNTTAVLRR